MSSRKRAAMSRARIAARFVTSALLRLIGGNLCLILIPRLFLPSPSSLNILAVIPAIPPTVLVSQARKRRGGVAAMRDKNAKSIQSSLRL